jgi:hypothetical protein
MNLNEKMLLFVMQEFFSLLIRRLMPENRNVNRKSDVLVCYTHLVSVVSSCQNCGLLVEIKHYFKE